MKNIVKKAAVKRDIYLEDKPWEEALGALPGFSRPIRGTKKLRRQN